MTFRFLSLLIFLFILLSDPDGGTCQRCSSYLEEIGVLPDTTLAIDEIWKIDIENELVVSYGECDGNGYVSDAPEINFYQSKNILSITKARDSLFIEGIEPGTTTLTLVSGSEGSVDPEIWTQSILLNVE
jgi:hypothetical protein